MDARFDCRIAGKHATRMSRVPSRSRTKDHLRAGGLGGAMRPRAPWLVPRDPAGRATRSRPPGGLPGLVCQVAMPQHFLDAAKTPQERQRRLEALRTLGRLEGFVWHYPGAETVRLIREWRAMTLAQRLLSP